MMERESEVTPNPAGQPLYRFVHTAKARRRRHPLTVIRLNERRTHDRRHIGPHDIPRFDGLLLSLDRS